MFLWLVIATRKASALLPATIYIKARKKHEACVAGWITRKKNLHLEERNCNILMDRLEGISYKELSKKYNLCSRQIYDILRRG